MSYSLEFKPSAFKEWNKLDNTVKTAFKKKLAEVLQHPKIEANRLIGLPNCYKIKLRRWTNSCSCPSGREKRAFRSLRKCKVPAMNTIKIDYVGSNRR